jgi:autophagy-related protein 9
MQESLLRGGDADCLLPVSDDDRRDWAVSNLDAFFSKVYNYYLEEGFWCIVVGRITNLVTLGFTVCFSTFLLLFVDWPALIHCSSVASCANVQVVRSNVFEHTNVAEGIIIAYFLIFSMYWFWNLVSFGFALKDSAEIRFFYNKELKISDDELCLLEWSEVVEKIVKLQETIKLCIVKDLTALDITNRVMRKDNYMVALVNRRFLDFSLPSSCCGGRTDQDRTDRGRDLTRNSYLVYGKTLEWSVRFCFLNSVIIIICYRITTITK